MKKLILFVAIALCTFNAQAQDKINWLTFEDAIKQNAENPKLILINVYADWCGYCKKMEKETYSNPVLIEYINKNFYAIKLNGEGKEDINYKGYTFKYKEEGRTKYHELAAALLEGQLSYPTTIFMTGKEELLQKIPGYLSTNRFEVILAFFKEDAYKTQDWAEYEKNFKSNLQ